MGKSFQDKEIEINGIIYPVIHLSKKDRHELGMTSSLSTFIYKKCDNPICLNEFYTGVAHIKKGMHRFCSSGCGISFSLKGIKKSEEHKLNMSKSQLKPESREMRICQNPECEKEFEIYITKGKRPGKYCSMHCRAVCYRHSEKVLSEMRDGRRKGENCYAYGTHLSEERKRQSRINALQRNKGRRFIGNNEVTLLNQYEELHNCKLQRGVLIKSLGYIVDGYCKETNTVVEVYERYHFYLEKIKHDKERQDNIVNFLNCDFIIIKDESYYGKKKKMEF